MLPFLVWQYCKIGRQSDDIFKAFICSCPLDTVEILKTHTQTQIFTALIAEQLIPKHETYDLH